MSKHNIKIAQFCAAHNGASKEELDLHDFQQRLTKIISGLDEFLDSRQFTEMLTEEFVLDVWEKMTMEAGNTTKKIIDFETNR